MDALIGYTGFVGSNIKNQKDFDYYYNTKNIDEIVDKSFNTIVCAGVSGVKFFANENPKKDYDDIISLIEKIDKCFFNKFVLISTLSVYDNPADNAYGRNRLYLENYVRNNFNDYLIVRLPGLFGKNLKKNTIYDLINKDYQYLPDETSVLQYYCLDNIWADIECALKHNLKILNIGTEPIVFKKILDLFSIDSPNSHIVNENMKSKHSKHWGKNGDYLYSKEETLSQLKKYIKTQSEAIRK